MNEPDHPTDEQIAALLDGTLSPGDRHATAAHLAACDACRALLGTNVVEHTSLAPRYPQRRFVAARAAAAAAAVILLGLTLRPHRTPVSPDQVRGDRAGSLEPLSMRASSPLSGASLVADTLVLRWAPAGDGATYDVSILDARGSVVWKTHADSPVAVPPADVRARLRPGERYHWQVDALLPDLRTMSTGPQEFTPLAR